jgi:hypothetical protein
MSLLRWIYYVRNELGVKIHSGLNCQNIYRNVTFPPGSPEILRTGEGKIGP